ncbi:MAG: hypothetical protein GDA67_15390 [Nitrospira sp. CR1.3]|nr:hypothetical protein [Nitrospira sp. CR1.3]QDV89921.1 hypothetical protein RAS2_09960 [Phycisphaerae bacterium RAS2]
MAEHATTKMWTKPDQLTAIDRQGSALRIQLTARDVIILDAITHRVKLLSLPQIARTWWKGSRAIMQARKRIRQLALAGYLERLQLFTNQEVMLLAPLATWHSGMAVPDFSTIVRLTRTRWELPIRSTACVVATSVSAVRTGGSYRIPRNSEATHDLHVAQVYLHKLRQAPRYAEKWSGEMELLTRDIAPCDKVPDALIRQAGRCTAVEVVGESYSVTKLMAFHEFCSRRSFTYELW